MTSALELLRGAVRAVAVDPPGSLAWFGQRIDELPDDVMETMTAETACEYLRYRLQWQLYESFYCRGFATPRLGSDDGPLRAKSSLVELLSAANGGSGPFEPGWQVEGREGDRVIVARDGLRLWLRPTELTARPGGRIDVESPVSVRFPKELRKLLPGYYMALGDCALPERGEAIVRFYWNLTPEGGPHFVHALTARLNRAKLAFRLKVVDHERAFNRCDAGVLYARTVDYGEVAARLPLVHGELARWLKPATPALTKRLAPGLGLAEEPGTGQSFGEHRCALIAEGLVRATEAGAVSVEDRLATVVSAFTEAGIRVEEPFVNPGSRDNYEWPGAGNGAHASLRR